MRAWSACGVCAASLDRCQIACPPEISVCFSPRAAGHGVVASHSRRVVADASDAADVDTCKAPRRSLAAKWHMPAELAIDVAALALYDVVVMAGAFNLQLPMLTTLDSRVVAAMKIAQQAVLRRNLCCLDTEAICNAMQANMHLLLYKLPLARRRQYQHEVRGRRRSHWRSRQHSGACCGGRLPLRPRWHLHPGHQQA